jgi:hypothetical protein
MAVIRSLPTQLWHCATREKDHKVLFPKSPSDVVLSEGVVDLLSLAPVSGENIPTSYLFFWCTCMLPLGPVKKIKLEENWRPDTFSLCRTFVNTDLNDEEGSRNCLTDNVVIPCVSFLSDFSLRPRKPDP